MRAKLGLFVLALGCTAAMQAQPVAGFGAVAGRIRDNLGDGLPDTNLVISNDTLGLKRTVRTTDDGVFTSMMLPPATGYSIKATRAGFAAWEYKNFSIALGSTVSFTVVMHPQGEAQTANPNVFTSSVSESRFDVSTLVTERQMDNLPNAGRSLENMILLAPDVTRDPNSGRLAFRGEQATNSLLTDGIETVNTYFFKQTKLAPQLTPDMVSAMEVISADAPPGFPHTTGGTVNTLTRRGSEEYHGSAYGFFSDHDWDAADRYGQFHPARQWEQGGARLGGPIRPGDIYFFANLEGWQGRSEGRNELSSAVLAGPQGTSLASNCTAPAAQCAAAIRFLEPQVNAIVPRSTTNATGFARVDYLRSSRTSFGLEANAFHDRSPNGAVTEAVAPNGGLLGNNGLLTDETRFAAGHWTSQLGGTMANQLRAGWYNDRISNALNPALEPSTGALGIQIAGASVGSNPAFPRTINQERMHLQDDFTWTILTHMVKIGADVARNVDSTNQLNEGAGYYSYPSLTAFAMDFAGDGTARNYSSFAQTFNHPIERNHSLAFSSYLQDDWRPLRRLNVELGMRWIKYRLPHPQFANATYYQTFSIASPSNAFAPHFGLSYLVDDRTVIRFGAGQYYQPFPGELIRSLLVGNDVYQTNISISPTQTGAPAFPNLISNSDLAPTQTRNVYFSTSKFRQPYTEEFNVSIERRLGRDLAGVLSYVDNRGMRLWTANDVNLVKPIQNRTYLLYGANNNFAGVYTTPIWTAIADTTHAHVYQIGNNGLSRSRSLTVQLRKAMAYGLTAQVAFTWSHTFDDVSGPEMLDFIPATMTPADYRSDESNSPFDQRHLLVFNWVWQPRPLHGDSAVAKLANGWQLSGIFTAGSGLPETPVVMVSGQQFAAAGKAYLMDYTNSLNGSGGWNRDPFVTPQLMRTDPSYVANFRLTRAIPITERVKGMLMFETFNALNRQYSTSLNTIAYTAALGQIRPVAGVGTGNASNGYPFGTNARFCQVAFRVDF